jgi:hypothetical protein
MKVGNLWVKLKAEKTDPRDRKPVHKRLTLSLPENRRAPPWLDVTADAGSIWQAIQSELKKHPGMDPLDALNSASEGLRRQHEEICRRSDTGQLEKKDSMVMARQIQYLDVVIKRIEALKKNPEVLRMSKDELAACIVDMGKTMDTLDQRAKEDMAADIALLEARFNQMPTA